MTNTIKLCESEMLLAIIEYVAKRTDMRDKFVSNKRIFQIGSIYFAEIEIDDIENAPIAGDP